MGEFKISVIIPVFNAEKFIERAVRSVILQPEVDEIILIDDGSRDSSFEILQHLEQKDSRIKLSSHANSVNKGAASSRNVGILMAKNEWIAFLDVDDYYLPSRFKYAVELIEDNAQIDGIYEAIAPLEDINNPAENRLTNKQLLTLESNIPSQDLFYSLSPIGQKGLFHCNGFLVRKNLLLNVGLFDEKLRIGEDVLLWLKLSIAGKLVGGKLSSPVAVFTRHSANTTFGGNVAHHLIPVFYALLDWQHPSITEKQKIIICDRLLFAHAFYKQHTSRLDFLYLLIKISIKLPSFIFSIYFINNVKFLIKHNFNQ
jgi:glycosyltransferase involved in cell wall biosynthesis